MHKKYYLIIMLAHLAVPVSLLFPVLRVDEIRLGVSGATTTSAYYLNIFEFIYSDIYTLTGLFILFLAIAQIAGVIIAIVGMSNKTIKHIPILLSFVLGFSSAIMSALQIYSGSYMLFIISAISFVVVSIFSVNLMKLEEKQKAQQ